MSEPTIFFVDDDPRAGELFERFGRGEGWRIETFRDPRRALAALREHPPELLVTDLKMPGMSGMDLLKAARAADPELPVVLITGYSTVDDAIEALRLGAADFLKKPYDPEELLQQIRLLLANRSLRQENRALRTALAESRGQGSSLLGESAPMQELRRLVARLAEVRCNVIVQGESGTGKELVARDLHALSPWAEQPFVVIDCGALGDTLLESELFGHEKGAFTGADQRRIGRLESARGGTVFLDEIGNISDAMQTKLLRVVQEQQITRVGGSEPIDIDVRFIVATHRDLEAMVAEGRFRHDLYHRLNVVRIDVPPLRARREDIPLLAQAFVAEMAERFGRPVQGFSPAAMQALLDYHWPGNVRELRNLVERCVALAEGPVLELPGPLGGGAPAAAADDGAGAIDADQPDLRTLERRYILRTLARFDGNREKTAAALGINKSTLWRRLQQYEAEGAGSGD